jgi:hypothetical protein
MAKRSGAATLSRPTLDAACDVLEAALRGAARAEILHRAQKGADGAEALRRLRAGMRGHAFRTAGEPLVLEGVVRELDRRTRREGFRVLHAWDPVQHRFTDEIIPVLLLDYAARAGVPQRLDREALAILLDVYFLYLLALLSLRAWDAEDASGALDRVGGLLAELQGPSGSGYRFADDAETLLLLATSQYQPDEPAYDHLLERVRALGASNRLTLARVGAANLGSHLRWGFGAMYGRDPARMRADNQVDYPWLLFVLATLMDAFRRMRAEGAPEEARRDVVEGLLNGLSADPSAFIGEAPECLAEHGPEHAWLRGALRSEREALLPEMERLAPSERSYSPLAFQFNFLHNALVAKVTTRLLQGGPNLSLNALFTREPPGLSLGESPEVLARLLMDFSGGDPARLGSRGARLVVYDLPSGAAAAAAALESLRSLS